MNENLSYQETLDQLLEYRKLVARMEDEVTKKENEKQSIIQVYQDMKVLYEKSRIECNDLNIRLKTIIEEKQNMENKYKSENSRLQGYFEKQKTTYEKQLKSINELNDKALRNKIAAEIEVKYTNIIKEKDNEIENLNEKLQNERKSKVQLEAEHEDLKESSQREIDRLQKKNENDMKEMMNKLSSFTLEQKPKKNIDGDEITPLLVSELKIQLTNAKNQINTLNALIQSLKAQNNSFMINGTVKEENYRKELNAEKYHSQILQNQIIQLTSKLEVIENECKNNKAQLEISQISFNNVQKENEMLTIANRDLTQELNQIKNEVDTLRRLIEKREREMSNLIEDQKKQNEQRFFTDKENIQTYQEQIEQFHFDFKRLTEEYKDNIDKEKESKKQIETEKNKLSEEKSILMNQLNQTQVELEYIRGDYENKIRETDYFKNEYERLDAKLRDVNNSLVETEKRCDILRDTVTSKEKEIKTLNGILSKTNKTSYKNDQYVQLLKKKNYYKNKCKECNENIKLILQNLEEIDIRIKGLFNKNYTMDISNEELVGADNIIKTLTQAYSYQEVAQKFLNGEDLEKMLYAATEIVKKKKK